MGTLEWCAASHVAPLLTVLDVLLLPSTNCSTCKETCYSFLWLALCCVLLAVLDMPDVW